MVRPHASARPVIVGAAGGVLAASVALVVATLLAVQRGHAPVAVLNGVGAWLVRWLHTAAPQALDNFYLDASVGGVAVALGAGALVGAVAAGAWARATTGSGLGWGLGTAALAWAAARWILLPALDPAMATVLAPAALAVTCLAFGLVLGLWLGALRALDGGAAATGP